MPIRPRLDEVDAYPVSADEEGDPVTLAEARSLTFATMESLVNLDHPVRGMAENTRLRLTSQARLQHARKTGEPAFELRQPEPGKGFDLLPQKQPGDIFYDIEGDPHFEGGLEYLHGVWFDGEFRAFYHSPLGCCRLRWKRFGPMRSNSSRGIAPSQNFCWLPARQGWGHWIWPASWRKSRDI